MMSQKDYIKLLLEHLLGRSIDKQQLRHLLEEFAVTTVEIGAILDQLERVITWQDDPEWLEELAAAKDGFVLPQVALFLQERDVLLDFMPDLVMQVDTLLEDCPADQEEFLPYFPTFAQQFEMS